MRIVITEQKKEFKPFVLSLEIESKDELVELYNRFNFTEEMIKESLGLDYRIPINPSKNEYEIFKILESTYIEKQAELISIAFRQRLKGIILDDEFNEYVHIISQLNYHLISTIDGDIIDIKRYIIKKEPERTTEVIQDDFIKTPVYYELEHILNRLGFIEEEPQYINLEPDFDGRPKTGIDLERIYKRTNAYFDFYSKVYQFSELEIE